MPEVSVKPKYLIIGKDSSVALLHQNDILLDSSPTAQNDNRDAQNDKVLCHTERSEVSKNVEANTTYAL